ncbi:MAG: AAA family ATPase [Deltaproteobacteria bacterium]|nr:AAA family ATPase [Deltaproteobacteria bacterium]
MDTSTSALLESITLEGFLSFACGPYGLIEMPLEPLNVIIGPNGSGKSNLIEAMSVLRAVPRDLPLPIRKGGGVMEWFSKGNGYGSSFSDGSGAGIPAARIEVVFGGGHIAQFRSGSPAVRYRLVFGAEGDSFVLLDERLENAEPCHGETKPYFYFGYENGRPMLNVKENRRELRREDIDRTQSIVSQRKDPDAYPELTRLGELLGRIRIYRSWHFGPDAGVRAACSPDVRTDFLSEDFDNLPARLAALKRTPAVKRRLVELIQELGQDFDDIEVVPEGGLLNLYLEEGGRSFPARRLSDGILRYLCLLAILVDPQPPPLLVIEEPELGLHPDILPTLRDLMIEASSRSQLIVTTHSTELVDTMTDYASSVLICEKKKGATILSRLTQEEVDHWRKHGGLGKLWMEGHFGGMRW